MARSSRKHFGVLCSTIDIANQYEVWKGIVEIAEAEDVHLTAYISTYQTTDNNFYSYLDSCFDAMFGVDSAMDGLIIMSGFVSQNIGLEEFEKYMAMLPKHIPMVSVSFEVQDIPSVVTYNKGGMYSAVEHLIKVHDKKHIAFVKGPDGHPEAEERLRGYKEALRDNGIEYRDEYVFPGDFGRNGGRNAVRSAVDEMKLDIDAFACCNDQSAVGVLQFLKDRDIMVPDDVAVTGFDDDIISSIYVPAIGTVGQDFKQLGRVSAQLLIDRINGREVDDVTNVIPEYIPRQSCGCLGREDLYIKDETAGRSGTETLHGYVERRFIELMETDVPLRQITDWTDTLLGQILKTPFDREAFLAALDRILVMCYYSYSKDFSAWHKALIALAMGAELYSSELENPLPVLTTLTYATTLVYDIRMNEEKKREYNLNDERMVKRRNTNALLHLFDVEKLIDVMNKSVNALSMKTAFIGVFRKPVRKDDIKPDRTIETLIGFDGNNRINVTNSVSTPISISDYSTFRGFDFDRERRTFFYHPLFVTDEEVGVMLLPYDPEIPTDTYETIRINISTTLKGAQLLSTIQTLSVTDELTGLYNRRGFFRVTESRLRHYARSESAVPIVMFMDMDGLKLINDNYGHKEGDIAIRAFADIVKSSMRGEDIIGRIGGDEFAAVSSVKSKENAVQLENRIRAAFDEYNAKEHHPYKVNGSIGCVVLEAATRECFEEAMLSADSVLYEEKKMKRQKGMSR